MIHELSASHITQTALDLLKLQRIIAWRQHNIAPARRRNMVKKGVCDILGYEEKTGIIAACECKKIGDTLKDGQKKFLQGVHDNGGLALIAHQVGNHVVLTPYVEYIKKYR